MRLEKKIGKKIATLALAAAMAVGGSLSVFAATGFTVSAPSLTNLGGYIVSGSISYSASSGSGTYYLQDVVIGRETVGQYNVEHKKAGYGYNAASAMTDTMNNRPYYIQNEGSYKSGSGFTVVDTKFTNNP